MAYRRFNFWMMPDEFPDFLRNLEQELDVSFVAKSSFELDGLIAGEIVDLDDIERMKLYQRIFIRTDSAEPLRFERKTGKLVHSLDWAILDLPKIPDSTVIPSSLEMETKEPFQGGRGYEHREKLYAAVSRRVRKIAHLTVYYIDPGKREAKKYKYKCSEAVKAHIEAGGKMHPSWASASPLIFTPILPEWAKHE